MTEIRFARRALALLALFGVVLVACSSPGGGSGSVSGSGSGAGTEAASAAKQAGEGAPLLPKDRLELPTFDFEKFQRLLGQLRGTPVLLNVWGSWCPPCRVEAPDLADLGREFGDRVQFLGIDILDQREAARDFILEFDWPYPSVFDPPGEIRDRMGYFGQPVTVILDREGNKTFEWVGATTAEQLRPEIEKVL